MIRTTVGLMAAICIAMLSTSAVTAAPPGFILTDQSANHSDDTGSIDKDCGIGMFHVQDVGGVKVCTPASSVNSEQTYDPNTGTLFPRYGS